MNFAYCSQHEPELFVFATKHPGIKCVLLCFLPDASFTYIYLDLNRVYDNYKPVDLVKKEFKQGNS
jgi:hypothetical protein